jgi:hypothetical protein
MRFNEAIEYVTENQSESRVIIQEALSGRFDRQYEEIVNQIRVDFKREKTKTSEQNKFFVRLDISQQR